MSIKGKVISSIVGIIITGLIIICILPKCDLCDKIGAFNYVNGMIIDKLCNECYDDYYEIDNYSYDNDYSYSSFTNKYGTSTTKCAHNGCSNYIASSGDTNCCITHSRKCLECYCYIDEDATWCMDCLESALQ